MLGIFETLLPFVIGVIQFCVRLVPGRLNESSMPLTPPQDMSQPSQLIIGRR